MGNPSVTTYTDYREYLKDYYEAQKRVNVSYSYRLFALRAKLSSPNYLKLVIDGSRRITDKMLPNFIRGLRLTAQEAEYFRNLISFQDSKDADTKNLHLQEVLRIRQKVTNTATALERDRLEFLKSWHHWIIREMTVLEDFVADPQWIASRSKQKITPSQAAESLELLLRLGFLSKDDHGKISVNEPLITTGDDISVFSLLLKNMHRQFLEFAIQSLLNDPSEEREFNILTIAVPSSKLPEMKNMIREFRRELNRRFSQLPHNDEVYNLSLAFFPMTQRSKK